MIDQNQSFVSRLCSIGVYHNLSTTIQPVQLVQRGDNSIQRIKYIGWSTFYHLDSDLSTG